jgi:hypothetical protein
LLAVIVGAGSFILRNKRTFRTPFIVVPSNDEAMMRSNAQHSLTTIDELLDGFLSVKGDELLRQHHGIMDAMPAHLDSSQYLRRYSDT